MVDAATAVEGNGLDAGLEGALAHELTDLLGSLLVLVVVPLNSASRVEAETRV